MVGFLSNVREDHPDMLLFFERVRAIVRANEQGPRVFLKPIYRYYFSLLCNKMREMALSIFTQYNIPSLRVRIIFNVQHTSNRMRQPRNTSDPRLRFTPIFAQIFDCLMEKLNAVARECYFLSDFVPLNLMMLDCRRVNRVLINMVHEVQEAVTNYFQALNTKENRR